MKQDLRTKCTINPFLEDAQEGHPASSPKVSTSLAHPSLGSYGQVAGRAQASKALARLRKLLCL